MPERSNFHNASSSWKRCKVPNSVRQLPRWIMRVTLRTSNCCNGTSICEFGTDCSKIRNHSNPNNHTCSSNKRPTFPRMHYSNLLPFYVALISLILLVPHFVNSKLRTTEYSGDDRERYMPTKCESCLIFANELDADAGRLAPKMPRDEAEAWLLDELEQLCERMLTYRVHKEKRGLARFSKQMSETAKTIRNLKQRGVEVKLDVSDELLDRPSIESGKLKEHCEWIMENFEDHIEHWFLDRRKKEPISQFLCTGTFSTQFDCQMARERMTGDEL